MATRLARVDEEESDQIREDIIPENKKTQSGFSIAIFRSQ
jgi:hypothetical protein